MDLIDREALVAEWKNKLKRLIPDSDGMHSISLEKAIEALEKAPTVDAEPVVYCKECVRRYDITCPMHYEEHVSHWTGDGYLESDIVEYDNTIDMGFCHLCCNGCD